MLLRDWVHRRQSLCWQRVPGSMEQHVQSAWSEHLMWMQLKVSGVRRKADFNYETTSEIPWGMAFFIP